MYVVCVVEVEVKEKKATGRGAGKVLISCVSCVEIGTT